MLRWNRHSVDGALMPAVEPSCATNTTSVSGFKSAGMMPDAVISIPPSNRTEMLPERPGLKPLLLICLAARMIACRSRNSGCRGMAGAIGIEGFQSLVRSGRDASLGDEARNQPGRCNIECWIGGWAAWGRNHDRDDVARLGAARHMRDFGGAAILNGN